MAYVRVAHVTFGKIRTYIHTYTYMHTTHACARAHSRTHTYHTHTAYIYVYHIGIYRITWEVFRVILCDLDHWLDACYVPGYMHVRMHVGMFVYTRI